MKSEIFDLELFLDEEVFIVGEKEVIEDTQNIGDCTFGEVEILQSKESVGTHLAQLSPSVDGDVCVVHGILTSALTLPSTLDGMTAFILASDGGNYSFLEIDPSKGIIGVEEVIQSLTEGCIDEHDQFEPIDIESIFIVYGYEMSLLLSISDDELDDEKLYRCQKLSEIAHSLKVDVESDPEKMQEFGYEK